MIRVRVIAFTLRTHDWRPYYCFDASQCHFLYSNPNWQRDIVCRTSFECVASNGEHSSASRRAPSSSLWRIMLASPPSRQQSTNIRLGWLKIGEIQIEGQVLYGCMLLDWIWDHSLNECKMFWWRPYGKIAKPTERVVLRLARCRLFWPPHPWSGMPSCFTALQPYTTHNSCPTASHQINHRDWRSLVIS